MHYVITGATGHLGRLAVEALLARGVPADHVIATGREASKAADLAERGVQVRRADYTDPGSLRRAFDGADRVLFVSGSEVGARVAQHRAVIDAARDAGVGLVAYTSIANAGSTRMRLAEEHQATEQALAESGVPFALLRNGWYTRELHGPARLVRRARRRAGQRRLGPRQRRDPRRLRRGRRGRPAHSTTPPGRHTSWAATTPSLSPSWPRP